VFRSTRLQRTRHLGWGDSGIENPSIVLLFACDEIDSQLSASHMLVSQPILISNDHDDGAPAAQGAIRRPRMAPAAYLPTNKLSTRVGLVHAINKAGNGRVLLLEDSHRTVVGAQVRTHDAMPALRLSGAVERRRRTIRKRVAMSSLL
jgi:hypothetical protein